MTEDAARPVDPPSGKTFVEWAIAVAGVLVAATGLYFTYQFSSLESARAAERDREANRATERDFQFAQDQMTIEVLETWLPALLSGEDPEAAERIIVGLLPNRARDEFSRLRDDYESAGLLTTVLRERLERAIQGASRVQATAPDLAVEVDSSEDREQAEAIARETADRGFTNVEVLERDDGFAVVIRQLPTQAAAEAVLGSVVTEEENARVIDLSVESETGPEIDVPDVVRMTEADALESLGEAGFTDVVVWPVASNSVEVGVARELILNDGAAPEDESTVVGLGGVVIDRLAADTALALKVSTGPRD